MRPVTIAVTALFATTLATMTLAHPIKQRTQNSPPWNPQAAAHYLDSRELWWQSWDSSEQVQNTRCISCHTQLPYALALPVLSQDTGLTTPSGPTKIMLASIEKRVLNWSNIDTFYTDESRGPGKTIGSRTTEAVLNATILATIDTPNHHLRPVTFTAFDNAWALQETAGDNAGGWKWQIFHLSPWEGDESSYQAATLLYQKALNAPQHYVANPTVRPHIASLFNYLQQHYATQPLLNQIYILWASASSPALITAEQRYTLLTTIHTLQQPDGGWCTSTLDPHPRKDQSSTPTASDAYATGLIILALQASGTPRRDPTIQHALTFLSTTQNADGSWSAASLNKLRKPGTDAYLFMSDAATAYAALALHNSR